MVLNSTGISVTLFVILFFANNMLQFDVTSNGSIFQTNASDTKHLNTSSYFFQYIHKADFKISLFSVRKKNKKLYSTDITHYNSISILGTFQEKKSRNVDGIFL